MGAGTSVILRGPDAQLDAGDPRAPRLSWRAMVLPGSATVLEWEVLAAAATGVVGPPATPRPEWSVPWVESDDRRLSVLLDRALEDLASLRMSASFAPDDTFLAAGAPWFFTLFGRDALWAARMLLPLGTDLAAGTLRALAARQGEVVDEDTAEQPGKILHEVRNKALDLGEGDRVLPPIYYGTVDATPLWVCLLHDAWRWGLAPDQVESLLPAMERALAWMTDYGDADGDGFLEYADTTGRGLANQGWKDSGDSVQWRDGTLAVGPIALCEVQGYAHEAALAGAALLDAFGRPGAERWRSWAADLARRSRTWQRPHGRAVPRGVPAAGVVRGGRRIGAGRRAGPEAGRAERAAAARAADTVAGRRRPCRGLDACRAPTDGSDRCARHRGRRRRRRGRQGAARRRGRGVRSTVA